MSEGNRSTAVMANRRAGESLQLFPTPPWATRSVIEKLQALGWVAPCMTAWDPACGKGHMAIPMAEFFTAVFASDVFDWGYGDRRDLDFSFARADDAPWPVDWIIANPPFTLGEAFLHRALEIARGGVALLLRLQWLEGGERYRTIFSTDRAPSLVCPFADRVAMIEEVWDTEASSATAYAWFLWHKGSTALNTFSHIAPGTDQRLTLLSDMALATPGEAARRKQERKASQTGIVSGPDLFAFDAVDRAAIESGAGA